MLPMTLTVQTVHWRMLLRVLEEQMLSGNLPQLNGDSLWRGEFLAPALPLHRHRDRHLQRRRRWRDRLQRLEGLQGLQGRQRVHLRWWSAEWRGRRYCRHLEIRHNGPEFRSGRIRFGGCAAETPVVAAEGGRGLGRSLEGTRRTLICRGLCGVGCAVVGRCLALERIVVSPR